MAAARASAEWASMSASRVWISAMRCGSCAVSASASSALALVVGGEHHLDQAFRPARRLLRHLADAGVLGQADRPALRPDLAGDQAEERGLAGAVRPDQADLGAVRQRHGGVVDQQALADPVGEVVDMQHGGGFVPRSGEGARPRVRRSVRTRRTG